MIFLTFFLFQRRGNSRNTENRDCHNLQSKDTQQTQALAKKNVITRKTEKCASISTFPARTGFSIQERKCFFQWFVSSYQLLDIVQFHINSIFAWKPSKFSCFQRNVTICSPKLESFFCKTLFFQARPLGIKQKESSAIYLESTKSRSDGLN